MKNKYLYKNTTGFSLVEMMASMVIIAAILFILASMLDTAGTSWRSSEERVETSQNGRTALELMTREMAPATINTCEQFVVLPGEALGQCGAPGVVETSQAAFWMAPLGKDGDLRAIGYYLQRDDDRIFYRLKRFYVGPENENYFPRGFDPENVDDTSILSEETTAARFLDQLNAAAFDDSDPENKKRVVSTVADGVIAMWLQCYDLLGNPIPWVSEDDNHPKSDIIFNSAAMFVMATSQPFENEKSFMYLADDPTSVKGNRLPAAVGITVVTLDTASLERHSTEIPEMENIMTDDGTLDVAASLENYKKILEEKGINKARTFTTRVKLATGS